MNNTSYIVTVSKRTSYTERLAPASLVPAEDEQDRQVNIPVSSIDTKVFEQEFPADFNVKKLATHLNKPVRGRRVRACVAS